MCFGRRDIVAAKDCWWVVDEEVVERLVETTYLYFRKWFDSPDHKSQGELIIKNTNLGECASRQLPLVEELQISLKSLIFSQLT